nr:cytochrome c oxidase subunit II [Thermicanus aegyptius]
MDLPRYEKIWITFGIGTLAAFLIIIGVMAFTMDLHPPGDNRTIIPEAISITPPFDKPGLYPSGSRNYKAAIVAKTFTFLPTEMRIPAGSTVHFEVTSPDVVHGLMIPGTNVNMLVVPGRITQFTYTFKHKGNYYLICNEYCGSGHQLMASRLIVE